MFLEKFPGAIMEFNSKALTVDTSLKQKKTQPYSLMKKCPFWLKKLEQKIS